MSEKSQLDLTLPPPRAPIPWAALNAEETAVANALRWGRRGARQVRDLARDAGIPSRRLQDVIERLVCEHKVPVGTSMTEPYGNYLIDNPTELNATVNLLQMRGVSSLQRAAALRGISTRQMIAQVQVDLNLGKHG